MDEIKEWNHLPGCWRATGVLSIGDYKSFYLHQKPGEYLVNWYIIWLCCEDHCGEYAREKQEDRFQIANDFNQYTTDGKHTHNNNTTTTRCAKIPSFLAYLLGMYRKEAILLYLLFYIHTVAAEQVYTSCSYVGVTNLPRVRVRVVGTRCMPYSLTVPSFSEYVYIGRFLILVERSSYYLTNIIRK